MPAFRARAEFRRRTRQASWVLAGVIVAGRFEPAVAGVEPIRGRLPEPGLVGWASLDAPIVAPDRATATEAALAMARAQWPDRVASEVPLAGGVAER